MSIKATGGQTLPSEGHHYPLGSLDPDSTTEDLVFSLESLIFTESGRSSICNLQPECYSSFIILLLLGSMGYLFLAIILVIALGWKPLFLDWLNTAGALSGPENKSSDNHDASQATQQRNNIVLCKRKGPLIWLL